MRNSLFLFVCFFCLSGCNNDISFEAQQAEMKPLTDKITKTCVEQQREYMEKYVNNFENRPGLLIDFLLKKDKEVPICTVL